MFNKFIVWGYKNVYDTHGHIHEGFYHALKHLYNDVQWLDETDDISEVDFSNSFIITNHACIKGDYWPWKIPRISHLPIRDDCFYAVHGLHDHPEVNELFKDHKWNLCWNVLTMRAMRTKIGEAVYSKLVDEIYIDEDCPFSLPQKYMEFRWATNLLPYEIEVNKPTELLSLKNKVINWVGTVWYVNEAELRGFAKAAMEDGVMFNHVGAGQVGVVSNEENQRLIRESWIAPAISGTHHLSEGYVPCRIFKNISYGQFGVTNNSKTNELFSHKLIFNLDSYRLYWQAKEQLQNTTIEQLHELMDMVKTKHTYLNRIDNLITAAKMIMQ